MPVDCIHKRILRFKQVLYKCQSQSRGDNERFSHYDTEFYSLHEIYIVFVRGAIFINRKMVSISMLKNQNIGVTDTVNWTPMR